MESLCVRGLLRLIAATLLLGPTLVHADPRCVQALAVKPIVDEGTKAVECIATVQQREIEGWSMNAIYSVQALAGSVAVRVAELARDKSTDSQCRRGMTADVANLRRHYDSAIDGAIKLGGLDMDIINRFVAQCKVNGRFVGPVARHGVKASNAGTHHPPSDPPPQSPVPNDLRSARDALVQDRAALTGAVIPPLVDANRDLPRANVDDGRPRPQDPTAELLLEMRPQSPVRRADVDDGGDATLQAALRLMTPALKATLTDRERRIWSDVFNPDGPYYTPEESPRARLAFALIDAAEARARHVASLESDNNSQSQTATDGDIGRPPAPSRDLGDGGLQSSQSQAQRAATEAQNGTHGHAASLKVTDVERFEARVIAARPEARQKDQADVDDEYDEWTAAQTDPPDPTQSQDEWVRWGFCAMQRGSVSYYTRAISIRGGDRRRSAKLAWRDHVRAAYGGDVSESAFCTFTRTDEPSARQDRNRTMALSAGHAGHEGHHVASAETYEWSPP